MTQTFIPFFFEKEPVFQHKDCTKFNPENSKCTRRNVIVQRGEFSCKERDVENRYQKFRCMHCETNDKIQEMGIKTYDITSHMVQVGFFKCLNCGEITAVFQLNGQQVVPVDPETEDVYDANWLAAKISVAV
ncbi:MAG: hypothetical protein PHT13_00920 [Methanosarcina sp.]|nr:hypothetical protein [Methanosarcina sp.]